MFEKYFGKYLINLFAYAFAVLVFGGWLIIYIPAPLQTAIIVVIISALLIGASYSTHKELEQDSIQEMENERAKTNIINEELSALKKTISEKSAGFPTLIELIGKYEKLQDDYLSNYLIEKSHPAYKASEVVKAETSRRRIAEAQYKQYKAIIDYYLSVAPFLSEIEEDLPGIERVLAQEDYSEEEAQDMTTRFLTKEEFRKLSTIERNQLALDRYWSHRKRSKWLVGKMYERFIGFLYEQKGWHVEYFGIKEKYEDLGRDLIAKKGKEIHIAQCKNWAKYKTIYENHIFQLFGTTFEYNERNKTKAKAVFFTTTKLSDVAQEMCDKLGILLMQDFPLKVYPSIKCNISRKTGEKIYHLPFDQQYDNTTIEEEKLEKYVMTVKEAEDLGFRRAYRWRGEKK